MSESVTLKSYFYEVLIPSSQKNTSSPIEDILHHVSISFMKKLALYKCFNPRTHTGCDTSPKNNGSYYDCFNPRTHTGCDFIRSVKHLIVRVSIHAPTRGATTVDSPELYGSRFQSTHPHGVRPLFKSPVNVILVFQSTHPHGVRLPGVPSGNVTATMFQSTHPHGVRRLFISA